MTSITSFRLMLAFTLISLSPCPNVQAQAPGLMGRDIKSSARMPLSSLMAFRSDVCVDLFRGGTHGW